MPASPPPGFARYEDSGDFLALVGPVYARSEADGRVFAVRIEERHRNAAGAAHGGLLMTLADSTLGRAIREDADDEAVPVTVSLTTDFLRPVAVDDWVEARATVERLGGRLAFADCSVRADGDEVVRARAVFAVRS